MHSHLKNTAALQKKDSPKPQNISLSKNKQKQLQQSSVYAASLSLSEIILGSILHGFKIPFGGHALSINQAFVLSRSLRFRKHNKSKNIIHISVCAALLKSLSPAGNKLGPMLSIGMQGVLFALPHSFLRTGNLSLVIASILLSSWAFIQPLTMLYLFFGKSLSQAFYFYSQKQFLSFNVSHSLLILMAVLFAVKCSLCSTLSILAYKKPFALKKHIKYWL